MNPLIEKLPASDPVLAQHPAARPRPGAPVLARVAALAPLLLASAVLAFFVLAAIAPNLLAPFDPLAINPADAFSPPGANHLLGTDESGRDIYSRIVHGSRPSLLIGAAATAIGLGLALVLGTIAGFGGKWLDFGVGRILEVLFALPGLLLALVFIALSGPGVGTTVIAVGLTTAPGYARMIRAQIIALRTSSMVEAATVLGRSRARILATHILPNALAPIAVLGTLGLGQAVVWAASLSFLGLGAPPPAPEWGAMLSAGRTYLALAWWMTFFPGLAIVLVAAASTVLSRSLKSGGNR
ncbi:ABC transporter permease [Paeniglutamicibacter psychrophenolicus]|uniref:Peptide/nickel transport system permease protein n=1 Tax=Paeniglutamicibacter psychrophenolicus TaxID=257454 RepID=A0ABS4WAR4_9MICC|nr:ABC transporter permease [Paeniglutamicibacter psychrophenolicus]MBP2373294.1 peptide/nickel transport system permease protein [Paeniglutamicibacter psychrophenolicus]